MRICVLMSSFNGERFIRQQIESILAQTADNKCLLIRDDGSTDSTRSVLREYATQEGIRVIYGTNVGVIASFFELLKVAPEADAYAFCDQDDWWHEGKLERQCGLLRANGTNVPAGTFCRLAVTDSDLNVLFLSERPRRALSLQNALVENVVTGCGLTINSAARALLLSAMPDPRAIKMHDWWIYQVLSALGKLIYDPEPGVWYRQHGKNAVGASRGWSQLQSRAKRLLAGGSRGVLLRQCIELERCFGDRLTESQLATVRGLQQMLAQRSGLRRFWWAIRSPCYRQTAVDTWSFRLLASIGAI